MASKKELSDLALDASIREYDATKEAKQIEAEKLSNSIRIGRRDADRGMHEVIYPNNSKTLNGNKIYSASNPDGMIVRATQPNKNLSVALDSKTSPKQIVTILSEIAIPKSVEQVAGLLAVASNYMQNPIEAAIIASLIAQMLGDQEGWNPDKKTVVTDKKILLHKGKTYDPLSPIQSALIEYGYELELSSDLSSEKLSDFSAVIARVVNTGVSVPDPSSAFPGYIFKNYIVGTQLEGLKSLLENKGLVVLCGCGCPYGSQPFNELLNELGTSWIVETTEATSYADPIWDEEGLNFTPWKLKNPSEPEIIEYVPKLSYQTYFTGVEESEAIAKASNDTIVMAYRPYPDVVTWK